MGKIMSGSMLNYDNIVVIAAVVLSVFLCKHRGLPGINFLLTGVLRASVFRVNVGETYVFTWWRQSLNEESKQKKFLESSWMWNLFFYTDYVVFQTCVANKEIVCPLVDKRCNVDIHIIVEGFSHILFTFFIFSFRALQMSQDMNI